MVERGRVVHRLEEARERIPDDDAYDRDVGGEHAGMGLVGDHLLAQHHYEESLRIARETGNVERMATCLNNLGYTLLLRQIVPEARACLRESLAQARSLSDTQGPAFALTNLGLVVLAQCRPRRARALLRVSLGLFRSLGDLRNSAEALEGLAEGALLEGDAVTAAQLLGTAAAYRVEIGAPRAAHVRLHVEHIAEAARIQLGESAFDAAWTTGQLQAKSRQI